MIAPDYATLLTAFTGADENPMTDGGNWDRLNDSNSTQLRRLGNQVTSNGTLTGECYWTPATYQDFVIYWTISTLPGSGNAQRLYGRLKDVGLLGNVWDGYVVRYQQAATSQLIIDVNTNATGTTLSTVNITLAAGDKIGMVCLGSMIQSWAYTSGAWALQATVFDSTYPAAGYIGIGVRGTTGRGDDLYLGVLGGAAGGQQIGVLS